MSQVNDIRGLRFGKLIVLEFDKVVNTNALWICLCDCGVKKSIHATSLKSGSTKSCGCLRGHTSKMNPLYGEWKTKEYKSWSMMKNRCGNKNATQYSWYGGRGIKVCERWNLYKNFLEDMGRAPSKTHSIDRKNSDGDYTKSNCRWATKKEQSNNRRGLLLIQYNDKKQSLSMWCNELGLSYHKAYQRLLRNCCIDEVLSRS